MIKVLIISFAVIFATAVSILLSDVDDIEEKHRRAYKITVAMSLAWLWVMVIVGSILLLRN